jgi:serine/threonine protein kinase
MRLTLGTRLGPYEITAPIGAGGMGEVYKAKDTRLDRTVAIKVLSEHFAESPERKARFEREAKAISQLNHPHITRCMTWATKTESITWSWSTSRARRWRIY